MGEKSSNKTKIKSLLQWEVKYKMTIIEKLKWLTDKKDGIGIPLNIVAHHANCHPSTISNYLNGRSEPTERLEGMLENGIQKILKIMNEKIGE